MANSLLKIQKRSWNKELVDGKVIYTPSDLDAGKQFKYIAFPVETPKNQSLREWFTFRLSGLQSELGEPQKKWSVNKEKDGTFSASNSFINQAGTKIAVGYNGIPLADGSQAFMIQMISSNEMFLLLQYGMDIDEVVKDAKSTLQKGLT